MRKVGGLIQRHLENILTFCRHRITNGVAEGLNSKIMAIKRKACGYRNREHFKTAIYFFCGGLDLYPKIGCQGSSLQYESTVATPELPCRRLRQSHRVPNRP